MHKIAKEIMDRIKSKINASGIDGITEQELIEMKYWACVADAMASFDYHFKIIQCLVGDDAVALVAVADGAELAVSVAEVVRIGGELLGNGGVLEVVAVLAPGVDSALIADDEHRGSGVLIHLSGQSLIVGAGGSRHDGDGNAGLLGVHGGDLLQSLVGLGLEVEPVNSACV